MHRLMTSSDPQRGLISIGGRRYRRRTPEGLLLTSCRNDFGSPNPCSAHIDLQGAGRTGAIPFHRIGPASFLLSPRAALPDIFTGVECDKWLKTLAGLPVDRSRGPSPSRPLLLVLA